MTDTRDAQRKYSRWTHPKSGAVTEVLYWGEGLPDGDEVVLTRDWEDGQPSGVLTQRSATSFVQTFTPLYIPPLSTEQQAKAVVQAVKALADHWEHDHPEDEIDDNWLIRGAFGHELSSVIAQAEQGHGFTERDQNPSIPAAVGPHTALSPEQRRNIALRRREIARQMAALQAELQQMDALEGAAPVDPAGVPSPNIPV